MNRRTILHADMDAFYASVEQRDRPELRGKPVIIGAQSARGVVSAASYEARRFGVRSAMPGFRARELCPQGVFLGGDMKKYVAVSKQVHAIFADFTNQIEPLALDEAFLDISGSLGLFGGAQALGRALKHRVRDELGLIVSVGIAPNKLVAKIACTQGKPDGLLMVTQEEIRDLMNPLPIRALFGVGPKSEQRLKDQGYFTIGDIADSTLLRLQTVFGRHALEMRGRARGEDDREVVTQASPKSIGEEATFSDDVLEEARIVSAINSFSEAVAARARRAGYRGHTVSIKVKLARKKRLGGDPVASHELFPVVSRQKKLVSATCDGAEIRETAVSLFRQLGLKEAIRLLGVTLSGLVQAETPRQLELFEVRSQAGTGATRSEQLGQALDAINQKFGGTTVRRGAEGVGKVTHSDRIKVGALEEGAIVHQGTTDDDESVP